MKLLIDRIIKDGKVLPGDILKVDGFINHQMDVQLIDEIGKEFHRLYGNCEVTKVLTIEASGIGIACFVAKYFQVPLLFAKKSKSKNISDNVYSSQVASFTHGSVNTVVVSKEYLSPEDKVLIIDDFLARGEALNGLIDIVNQAGATVVGTGTVIEKGYQGGGDALRAKGIRVESLAIIDSMSDDGSITFRN
ncbi:MAG: xanthine phosphoribosyltransferase [Clostridia bacterium]|nr:xanthine phosphoribosyltransferase [Clostridia bacterium]